MEGGGGAALLAWPTTAASLQITMEIHISNWTHKFQNRTGLDAKANLELYKSNRVCSAGQRPCSEARSSCVQFHPAIHLTSTLRIATGQCPCS
jgi:hypothetical protein